MRTTKRLLHGSVGLVLAAILTGCGGDFSLTNISPPGTGPGDDAYLIHVEFEDALGVPRHGIVKKDGLEVGSVEEVEASDWSARVTLAVRKDVEIPANTIAAIRQNSPLGEVFVSLDTPPDPSRKDLQDGDTIPLERTSGLVAIEDVLALMGTVTNGAALDNLRTIVVTIGQALNGRVDEVRSVLERSNAVLAGLVAQRADLDRLLVRTDAFTAQVARDRKAIFQVMENLSPVVKELAGQTDDIVALLARLRDLSHTSMRVIDATGDDVVSAVRDAGPVLAELRRHEGAMRVLMTRLATFAKLFKRASPGDFTNIDAVITLSKLPSGPGIPIPDPTGGNGGNIPTLPPIDSLPELPGLPPLLGGLLGREAR